MCKNLSADKPLKVVNLLKIKAYKFYWGIKMVKANIKLIPQRPINHAEEVQWFVF